MNIIYNDNAVFIALIIGFFTMISIIAVVGITSVDRDDPCAYVLIDVHNAERLEPIYPNSDGSCPKVELQK